MCAIKHVVLVDCFFRLGPSVVLVDDGRQTISVIPRISDGLVVSTCSTNAGTNRQISFVIVRVIDVPSVVMRLLVPMVMPCQSGSPTCHRHTPRRNVRMVGRCQLPGRVVGEGAISRQTNLRGGCDRADLRHCIKREAIRSDVRRILVVRQKKEVVDSTRHNQKLTSPLVDRCGSRRVVPSDRRKSAVSGIGKIGPFRRNRCTPACPACVRDVIRPIASYCNY